MLDQPGFKELQRLYGKDNVRETGACYEIYGGAFTEPLFEDREDIVQSHADVVEALKMWLNELPARLRDSGGTFFLFETRMETRDKTTHHFFGVKKEIIENPETVRILKKITPEDVGKTPLEPSFSETEITEDHRRQKEEEILRRLNLLSDNGVKWKKNRNGNRTGRNYDDAGRRS